MTLIYKTLLACFMLINLSEASFLRTRGGSDKSMAEIPVTDLKNSEICKQYCDKKEDALDKSRQYVKNFQKGRGTKISEVNTEHSTQSLNEDNCGCETSSSNSIQLKMTGIMSIVLFYVFL